MKKLILCMVIMMMATVSGFAQYTTTRSNKSTIGTTNPSVRYQSGYTRSNGTYVSGHFKTTSNKTNHDNFSTAGNRNTFTGTTGTRARDYSSRAYNYGSGKTIYTGSRGGQYYYNSRGNKTYVPKR